MSTQLLFLLFLSSVLLVVSPKQCILPNNVSCPNLDDLKSCQTLISSPNINYTCPLQLKTFNQILLHTGTYSNISIFATRVQIGSIQVKHQLIITANHKLTLLPDSVVKVRQEVIIVINFDAVMLVQRVRVECGKIVIYSVADLVMEGVVVEVGAEACTGREDEMGYPTEFLSIGYWTNGTIKAGVSILNKSMSQLDNMIQLSQGSNLGIYSEKEIALINSTLKGSTINLVSTDLQIDSDSLVTSEGTSCKSQRGIGRGIRFDSMKQCTSSGASSAGYGSTDCIQSTEYFSFILHSVTYGNKLNPQVTGSAGAFRQSDIESNVGAGGVIVIRVAKEFILDGRVNSNSENMSLNSVNSSAGSGGSVNILTGNFSGDGEITAKGGEGIGVHGHGSGGWLKVGVLDSNNFTGIVNTSSSILPLQLELFRLPDNGNMMISSCPPGSQQPNHRMVCNSCDDTSYKSALFSSCRACPNDEDLELSSISPKKRVSDCFVNNPAKSWKERSPLQFLIHYSVYRIGILIGLLLFFITMGFLLFKNFKKKKNAIESQGFDFNTVISDLNQNNVLTETLKNQNMFKMGDLLYHAHRITVFGTNTPDNPWRISSKLPIHLHSLVIPDSFQDFTKIFNKKAKWKLTQFILLYLSTLIYPLYWYLLVKIKKTKYKQVSKLIESSMLNFIQPAYVHDRKVPKAKISKSSDYTLCYVDIFDYYQADLKYFKLDSPFLVHISGEGNFIKPYYLCESDPFLNSLFMIVNRNISSRFIDDRFKIIDNLISHAQRIENSLKLNQFVKFFNRNSRSLDLGAPKVKFVKEIIKIIKYIHEWNRDFFSTKKIKLSLIMMVTYFKRDKVKDHQVNILENNNTEQFTKFMLQTLNNLENSPMSDIKFSLFVYNPEADISSVIEEKEMQISPFSMNMIETENSYHELIIKPPKIKANFNNKLIKICSRLRYLLISHKPPKLQKYTLRMLLCLLVLLNAFIITIWEQDWFMVPYIFMNLVAPFVGVLWLASGISYGVGKAFIVLNILSIVNNTIALIQGIAGWTKSSYFFKGMRVVILVIGVATSELGCQIMTSSKKLNQPKIS